MSKYQLYSFQSIQNGSRYTTQELPGWAATSMEVINNSDNTVYIVFDNVVQAQVIPAASLEIPAFTGVVEYCLTDRFTILVVGSGAVQANGTGIQVRLFEKDLAPNRWTLPQIVAVQGAGGVPFSMEQDELSLASNVLCAASSITTIAVNTSPGLNSLLILLTNSANVAHITVTGTTTNVPYYDQVGPLQDMIAAAISPSQDGAIDVFITMPVGQTCHAWVAGRRDALVSASTQLGAAPATTVSGLVSTSHNQVAASSGNFLAGTTHTTVPLSTDVNSLMAYFDNPSVITQIIVVGNQSGIQYADRFAPIPSPMLIPVATAYDTSVDVSVSVQALQNSLYHIVGRRDAALSGVSNFGLPTLDVTFPVSPTALGNQATTQFVVGTNSTATTSSAAGLDGYGSVSFQVNVHGTFTGNVAVFSQGSMDSTNWLAAAFAVMGATTVTRLNTYYNLGLGRAAFIVQDNYFPYYRLLFTVPAGAQWDALFYGRPV